MGLSCLFVICLLTIKKTDWLCTRIAVKRVDAEYIIEAVGTKFAVEIIVIVGHLHLYW